MESKREQALVGFFVLVATGLLLTTVFALAGTFHRGDVPYRAYFKFAAGLQPGGIVRYAGGPQIGRIDEVRADPQNPTRMEIAFRVSPNTPVKTDSRVKIASLSALGDNFLEIVPGTPAAPRAPSGSALQSSEYIGFDELTAKLTALEPVAEELLKNINNRVTELQDTITRINDLVDQRNRANISASLEHIHGMLEEDRPRIKSSLGNIDTASAKIAPLLDDFKKTIAQAKDALAHVDDTLAENRPDLRESISKLRLTLTSAASLTDQLDRTLNYNAENIDELLENMTHVSENLKAFTDTIKARPYTLIRSSGAPTRKPGGGKP